MLARAYETTFSLQMYNPPPSRLVLVPIRAVKYNQDSVNEELHSKAWEALSEKKSKGRRSSHRPAGMEAMATTG